MMDNSRTASAKTAPSRGPINLASGQQPGARAVGDKRDAALGDAIRSLFCAGKNGTRQPGKAKRIKLSQLAHLFHRLLIMAAALWYMITSIQSSVASLKVLRGVRNAPMKFEAYDINNILPWMGNGTVRNSPLVMQVLKNDTSIRNYTIYLEANGVVSTTGCSTPLFNSHIYSNFFLRLANGVFQRDCAYNITLLARLENVAPVIDCSFTPLVRGLDTNARAFHIMRDKQNHDDLYLQASRFSMQDYKAVETTEVGPIGYSHNQFIKDMSQPKIFMTTYSGPQGYPFEPARSYVYTPPVLNEHGWWVSTMVPPEGTAPKTIITAMRTGFYVGSDSEQANIKNQIWGLEEDPITVLTKWNWSGEPLLKDSWAWVHLVHVLFAADCLTNLVLLLVTVYRNMQKGRVWIGDAFTSISSTLMVRGVLILISWVINGFWSLMEYCLRDAHTLAGTQEIFFHPEIMRADLLTLFLGLSTIIGHAFRERIDPAFAVIVFEIVFAIRLDIVKGFPSVAETMIAFAKADLDLSTLGVSESVAYSSPLRLWTAHLLPKKDLKFIFSCLMPIFFALIFVVIYVVARKVYHRFFHLKIYKQDSKNTGGTHVSEGDEATMVLYKRNLTLFEIATGAELQTRYGVVSDFENYLFIKGMKYASADGIYSNGFVIANEKYLIAAEDWLPIAMQKLLRMRLRNIYAFQVEGNTVQRRARLVYPETFTWSDLMHLNVTVLS